MEIPVKGVIFDFDGTLADTTKAHIYSFIKALEEFGINNIDPLSIKDKLGMTSKEIVEKIVESKIHEIDEDMIEKIVKRKTEIFLNNLDKIELFPKVTDILKDLKSNNIKIGLASSGYRSWIIPVLEKNGILEYFDSIVCGDDVKYGKPHPDIYEKSIKNLGINKHYLIAVEDSGYGVIAAKNAGLHVFGVLTGVGDRKTLRHLGAIKIFKNVEEFWKFIKNHNYEIVLGKILK